MSSSYAPRVIATGAVDTGWRGSVLAAGDALSRVLRDAGVRHRADDAADPHRGVASIACQRVNGGTFVVLVYADGAVHVLRVTRGDSDDDAASIRVEQHALEAVLPAGPERIISATLLPHPTPPPTPSFDVLAEYRPLLALRVSTPPHAAVHTVMLYSLRQHKCVHAFRFTSHVYDVTPAPSGALLFVSCARVMYAIHAHSLVIAYKLPTPVHPFGCPRACMALSGDVMAWGVAPGTRMCVWREGEEEGDVRVAGEGPSSTSDSLRHAARVTTSALTVASAAAVSAILRTVDARPLPAPSTTSADAAGLHEDAVYPAELVGYAGVPVISAGAAIAIVNIHTAATAFQSRKRSRSFVIPCMYVPTSFSTPLACVEMSSDGLLVAATDAVGHEVHVYRMHTHRPGAWYHAQTCHVGVRPVHMCSLVLIDSLLTVTTHSGAVHLYLLRNTSTAGVPLHEQVQSVCTVALHAHIRQRAADTAPAALSTATSSHPTLAQRYGRMLLQALQDAHARAQLRAGSSPSAELSYTSVTPQAYESRFVGGDMLLTVGDDGCIHVHCVHVSREDALAKTPVAEQDDSDTSYDVIEANDGDQAASPVHTRTPPRSSLHHALEVGRTAVSTAAAVSGALLQEASIVLADLMSSASHHHSEHTICLQQKCVLDVIAPRDVPLQEWRPETEAPSASFDETAYTPAALHAHWISYHVLTVPGGLHAGVPSVRVVSSLHDECDPWERAISGAQLDDTQPSPEVTTADDHHDDADDRDDDAVQAADAISSPAIPPSVPEAPPHMHATFAAGAWRPTMPSYTPAPMSATTFAAGKGDTAHGIAAASEYTRPTAPPADMPLGTASLYPRLPARVPAPRAAASAMDSALDELMMAPLRSEALYASAWGPISPPHPPAAAGHPGIASAPVPVPVAVASSTTSAFANADDASEPLMIASAWGGLGFPSLDEEDEVERSGDASTPPAARDDVLSASFIWASAAAKV